MASASTGWSCVHTASVVSQTNTTATIRVTCYWQNKSWNYDINYVSAWVYCNGSSYKVKNNSSLDAPSNSGRYSLGSHDFTINKTTATQSISCYGKITSNSSYVSGTKTSSSTKVSVSAKPHYTVSYNANGGSGAPGSQTKWYGTNLTLSGTRPTRTGYSFAGWATSASGSVAYQPGGTYSSNSSVTLYAKWTANTYTVSYNANGGSGAPGNQTKTYGVNLTLSTTRPTRTNYNFLGWATSSSATSAQYQPGGTYTSNSGVTLYAVWQLAYKVPRISGFSAQRCTSNGTASESGTYIKVSFSWATDRTVSAVAAQWKLDTASSWSSASLTASGTSGNVSQVIGSGEINAESSYNVRVYVQDSGGTTYSSELSIGTIIFPIDIKSGGKGIAFGKVAESENVADFGWRADLNKGGTIPLTPQDGSNLPIATVIESTTSIATSASGMPSFIGSMYPNNAWYNVISCRHRNGTGDGTKYGMLLFSPLTVSGNLCFKQHINGTWQADKVLLDSSNYASYIISLVAGSVVGGFRFTSEWMGLYANQSNANNQTSRKGWIGFNGGNNLNLNVETGGNVFISSGLRVTGTVADDGNYGLTLGVNNNTDMVQVYQAGGTTSGVKRIQPVVDGELYCGVSSNRWKAVYAQTGSIQTSDRTQKKDINLLDNRYEQLFYKLKPVFYKFKDPKSDRVHVGYIAQDVEESMIEVGLTDMDFGGFCKDIKERLVKIDPKTRENIYETVYDDDGNPEYDYALRYEEFIALNTHMIQKAHETIQSQQKEIDDLKKQVQDLTELVLAMSKKEE